MEEVNLPPAEREAFNRAVWKIAALIPEGKVFSYGQIAGYIPQPASVDADTYKAYKARWAGAAMTACPSGTPWQRVISSQGKISYRQGADEQRRLLESEGIVFDVKERIDLGRFGWQGPDAEWLKANDLLPPNADLPLFQF
jgi:methylated-DNA-protein-cysteine methyltransferase related protein